MSSQYGQFAQESDGRLSGTVLFVTGQRKDGKYSVTYGFGSGKRIGKILTKEALEAEIARYANRA